MSKITVPQTLTEAQASLTSLDGLITAKEWERAAIVYAFTTDEIKGGPRTAVDVPQLSCREFAELGIAGLRSDKTVRRHRKAWQDAIDRGKALPVYPGMVTAQPDLPWGEVYVSDRADTGRSDSIELPVTTDPAKLADWFGRNPGHAARISQAAHGALTPTERAEQFRQDLSDPTVTAAAFADAHTRVQASDAIHAWHDDAGAKVTADRAGRQRASGYLPLDQNVSIILDDIRDLLVRFPKVDEPGERERALLQRGCERIKAYVDFWAGEEDTTISDDELAKFLGSEA